MTFYTTPVFNWVAAAACYRLLYTCSYISIHYLVCLFYQEKFIFLSIGDINSIHWNTKETSYLVIIFYSSRNILPQPLRFEGSLVLHPNSEALQSLTLDFWSGMPKDFLLLTRIKGKKMKF